jgi:hypothetical protein
MHGRPRVPGLFVGIPQQLNQPSQLDWPAHVEQEHRQQKPFPPAAQADQPTV